MYVKHLRVISIDWMLYKYFIIIIKTSGSLQYITDIFLSVDSPVVLFFQKGKVIDTMTLVKDKHGAGIYDCHLKQKKN